MVMASRLFLLYLVVESAALVGLIMAIGFGWTLLLFSVAFAAGTVLAGTQVKHQIRRLGSGRAAGALGDSALITLGTLLVAVPGLVTTAVGLLILLPVTRPAARPVLKGLAAAGLSRRLPLVTAATLGAHRYATRRNTVPPADFIDGEVISVVDGSVPGGIDVEARARSVD